VPLPSYLILPMQVALQSQGVPAEAISPQGEIDWSTIISNVVTDVELRTTVLPPYKIHLPDALKPAPPSAAMQFLKPTLIMSGPRIGRIVTAPYGESEGSWVPAAVTGGLLAALGWWFINR
jgi:hypothetical protein